MTPKKLLVIIPDGVGLRNFAYTNFPEEVKNAGWELIYWNATGFELSKLGLDEIRLKPKPRAWTDLLKRAKINVELEHFQKKFNEPIYKKYKFPASQNGLKNKLKSLLVSFLIKKYKGEKGLKRLRRLLQNSERKSEYYQDCIKVLNQEKPDAIFCTNQRPVNAISPVIAARDLGISTSCFIFSWDNLPKATKVIDTDYYLVWSEHMKDELMQYYPYIAPEQVKITGTPQFEIHYNKTVVLPRDQFFSTYGLDPSREYLCFSGDDVTTSPHDEYFLRDVARAVSQLNENGENIGIIFRRCPVDFSGRYNKVLQEFREIIVPIEPEWTGNGDSWNQAMPKKEDMALQTNIAEHCFMVINVASSMIFDFVAKGKPCAYLNYLLELKNQKKDIREIYSYIHFKTIPENAVFWINNKEEIGDIILQGIEGSNEERLEMAMSWFQKINCCATEASKNIVHQLDQIN